MTRFFAALRRPEQEPLRGRQYHTCFGTSDLLGVVDVWESLTTFEAFGEVLMPIPEEVSIEAPEPQISETYHIIA